MRRAVDAIDGAPRRKGLHDLVDQVGDVVDDEREGRRAVQALRRQVVVMRGGPAPTCRARSAKAIIVDAAVAGVEAAAMRGDEAKGGRLRVQNCYEVARTASGAVGTGAWKPNVHMCRKLFLAPILARFTGRPPPKSVDSVDLHCR